MAIRISPRQSSNKVIRSYDDAGDEELMKLFQHGDDKAYHTLINRHRGMMWTLVRKYFGSSADIDDIVQEISLSLWQNKDAWKSGMGKFSSWLYRVISNKCIDVLRQKKNHKNEDVSEDIISTLISAEEIVSQQQMTQQLMGLLSELPVQQKLAMQLFYYEEDDIAEICSKMDLSEQAVRSLLKRGKQKIREVIEPEMAYI